VGSWLVTSKKATSSPCFSHDFSMLGSSATQGGHQVAQKFSNTGFPLNSDRLSLTPCSVASCHSQLESARVTCRSSGTSPGPFMCMATRLTVVAMALRGPGIIRSKRSTQKKISPAFCPVDLLSFQFWKRSLMSGILFLCKVSVRLLTQYLYICSAKAGQC